MYSRSLIVMFLIQYLILLPLECHLKYSYSFVINLARLVPCFVLRPDTINCLVSSNSFYFVFIPSSAARLVSDLVFLFYYRKLIFGGLLLLQIT